MITIFDTLIAWTVLALEMILSAYLALLEIVMEILMTLAGWVCAPFRSKEPQNVGLSQRSKIAIRRVGSVIFTFGFGAALWLCWAGVNKWSRKPPPTAPANEAAPNETARQVWEVLEKKLEERQKSRPDA